MWAGFHFFFFLSFLGLQLMASRILAPRPRIEPVPPAVQVLSPNHWITKEVPGLVF